MTWDDWHSDPHDLKAQAIREATDRLALREVLAKEARIERAQQAPSTPARDRMAVRRETTTSEAPEPPPLHPELTACDWCRMLVAREDLVEHLESCEVRRWAHHYETCELKHTCPVCGQGFATEDGAADCRLTCYQKASSE